MDVQDMLERYAAPFMARARIWLSRFSDAARSHEIQAKQYFERNAFTDAAVHFRIAAWWAPRHAENWMGLGLSYAALGKWEKADAALRKALALKPGDAAVIEALKETRQAWKTARTAPQG